MPTYKLTDPTTGKTVRLTGDSPPTEDELNQVFASAQGAQQAQPGGFSIGRALKAFPAAFSAMRQQIPFPNIMGGNKATDIANKPAALVGQGLDKAINAIPDPQTQSVGLNIALGVPKTLAQIAAPIAASSLEPANIALAGLPETVLKPIGQSLEEGAVNPARRALGFTKADLSSTRSPFEAMRKKALANKAAESMLKSGSISKVGNPQTTMDNALKLMSNSGSQMGSIIEAADQAGLSANPNKIAGRLIDELKPKYSDQQQIVGQMLDDLQVHGHGPMPLNTVKELKTRWGNLGYQQKTVGTEAAKLYRKASDVIEKDITDGIDFSLGPKAAETYKAARSTYATSRNAMAGTQKELARQMGNNAVSPVSMIVAGSKLAGGDIGGSLGTLGILEALRRRGAGAIANTMYSAGKGLSNIPAATGPAIASLLGALKKRRQAAQ